MLLIYIPVSDTPPTMSSADVIDCRPADFASLSPAEQGRYMDGEGIEETVATISGQIFVSCDITKLAVATTHTEITDYLTILSRKQEHARFVFEGTLRNIVGNKDKIDALFEKGGKEWNDLCNDVVLYYCARCLIQKRPIPISGNVPRDRVMPGGGKRFNSFQDLPTCDSLPENVAFVNENPQKLNPDVVSATIVEDDEEDN